MTRGQVAAKVAKQKAEHPNEFCPIKKCLWLTGGGLCPHHRAAMVKSLIDDSGYTPKEAREIVMAGGLE